MGFIASIIALFLSSHSWANPINVPHAKRSFSIDPKKFTVCTLTINSTQEREVFQSALDPKQFQFVELVPENNNRTEKVSNPEQWFDEVCESGIQCDLLVVSGHFGGSFFGSSGKALSSTLLEKHSCREDCRGILRKPQEVFLFGCNTLAGKGADTRTQAQYVEVLVSDGMDRETAEAIAEARYGAFGNEFKDIMRRSFPGVRRIYGFDSVGPAGKNVKGMLENYFRKMGDYGAYLAKEVSKEATRGLNALNQRSFDNKVLNESLRTTNFTQCSGMTSDDPANQHRTDICALFNEKQPWREKLLLIQKMLESESRLSFFPAIGNVLTEEKISMLSAKGGEEAEILNRIKNNLESKKKILIAISAVRLPVLKGEWIILAKNLGWLSDEDFSTEAIKVVSGLLNPLSVQSVDAFESLNPRIRKEYPVKLAQLMELSRSDLGIHVIYLLLKQGRKSSDLKLNTLFEPLFKEAKKTNKDSANAFDDANEVIALLLNSGELSIEQEKRLNDWINNQVVFPSQYEAGHTDAQRKKLNSYEHSLEGLIARHPDWNKEWIYELVRNSSAGYSGYPFMTLIVSKHQDKKNEFAKVFGDLIEKGDEKFLYELDYYLRAEALPVDQSWTNRLVEKANSASSNKERLAALKLLFRCPNYSENIHLDRGKMLDALISVDKSDAYKYRLFFNQTIKNSDGLSPSQIEEVARANFLVYENSPYSTMQVLTLPKNYSTIVTDAELTKKILRLYDEGGHASERAEWISDTPTKGNNAPLFEAIIDNALEKWSPRKFIAWSKEMSILSENYQLKVADIAFNTSADYVPEALNLLVQHNPGSRRTAEQLIKNARNRITNNRSTKDLLVIVEKVKAYCDSVENGSADLKQDLDSLLQLSKSKIQNSR